MLALQVITAAVLAALPVADKGMDLFQHPPAGTVVPDTPATIVGDTIMLSAHEMASCVAAGGCILIPRAALDDKIKDIKRSAVAGCKNSI